MYGRMWPIKSELKTKRLAWGPKYNYLCWAALKEMRENDRRRRIYEINPHVEVYQYSPNFYALYTQNCDGAPDPWMYLIVGPQKALLIDTGYGLGNLKGLCDQLSEGKPLIVANTHAHKDHSYGNCLFDKVYCHEYEVPYLALQNQNQWDYLFDKNGKGYWIEITREDIPAFKPYEIIGVPDGYVFDLGQGYEVELIWVGGHSPGHSMFLDKPNRNLIIGELHSEGAPVGTVIEPPDVPYKEYLRLSVFQKQLQKVISRMDEYDYLFPIHGLLNIEKGMLPNFLTAVDEILQNPQNYDYVDYNVPRPDSFDKVSTIYYKYVKDYGTIQYHL